MNGLLQPIKTESLKDVFVDRFERLILSGELSIGERLPAERELALRLGVSRPVVHEGLVELAARGLVTMVPRKGAFVNDFRKQGSLALLNSLVNYHNGGLETGLMESMLEMRRLFEVENARLAAKRRTTEQLAELMRIVAREKEASPDDVEMLTELDFTFHHQVAMASGNLLYPLLINSFKNVYTNLTGRFFTETDMADQVWDFHVNLVAAIESMDSEAAGRVMEQMIDHGENALRAIIDRE